MNLPLNRFDIIISGAGAAGLSLAYHLSKSIWSDKRILLLDKDSKQSNDRTWCYWSKDVPEFECAKEMYWDKMSFAGKNYEKSTSISPYHYYHIRGIDFYQEIKKHLADFPNIQFRQEAVLGINDKDDCVEVRTEKENYQATWLFNSIPQLSPAFPLKENTVKQYFKGYYIKLQKDYFIEENFKLMDFSISNSNGIKFFYVLPFSPQEALVECTVFASNQQNPENYCDDIHRYIQTKLQIESYTIVEEEKGAIPMSVANMPFKSSKRVFHIGTAGGMTKAGTGYTFNNIQLFCKQFLSNWQNDFDNPPSNIEIASPRFKFYDSLLLHIIQTNPGQFQPTMEALFKRNDFQRILKFLDEDTSVLEDSLLFSTLPLKPFLKAVYEQNLSWFTAYRQATGWRGVSLGNTSHS